MVPDTLWRENIYYRRSFMDVYMEYDLQKPIPKAVFPTGYVFKPIPREHGHIWENVMDKAFGNYKAGDFESDMVDNYSYLPERVFVLFDDKEQPCGTASAWGQPWRWGDGYGYIIFVGVIPSHRSHGLSKQMLFSILETMKDRGEKFVLLDVESENLPAIKSYLNTGFLPRLTSNDESKIWNDIFIKLKINPPEYSHEIIVRMDNPHPPRPYLLDMRENGKE
jgi:ribosomal protein S18 acetylase RimI-like enzyme